MKIRIKGNSIRMRLTQSEVKTFCETGKVEDFTQFDTSRFNYIVKQGNVRALNALFTGNTITLEVPTELAAGWYENEVVGFEARQSLSDGGHLLLLLEKDFACMNHTKENQSDNYHNPKER